MPPAQNTVVMFQLRDDPRAAKRQARTLLVVYAAAVAPRASLFKARTRGTTTPAVRRALG